MTARSRGFTLLEIMITITIVAILSTMGIIAYGKAQSIARDAIRKQDLKNMKLSLELYYQRNGNFPSTTDGSGWDLSTKGGTWISGLDSTYTNKLPTDVKQTSSCKSPPASSCYLYGYFSTAWEGGTPGKGYILTAKLENDDDKDAGNTGTYQDTTAVWREPGYYTLTEK